MRTFQAALRRLHLTQPSPSPSATCFSFSRSLSTPAAAPPPSSSPSSSSSSGGASSGALPSSAPGSGGGAVAPTPAPLPDRARAGLSKEALREWDEQSKSGFSGPIVWNDPGKNQQVSRIPDAEMYALPPPRKPVWPTPPWDGTLRLLRAYSVGFVLLLLAGYLHAKAHVRGSVRLEMERQLPRLAEALKSLGFLGRYDDVVEALDRGVLLGRIFERFAQARGGGGPSSGAPPLMPAARAIALLAVLRDELPPTSSSGSSKEIKKMGDGPARTAPSDAARSLLERTAPSPQVVDAVMQRATPGGMLTASAFVAAALDATRDLSPALLYLSSSECLGVTLLSQRSSDALAGLYHTVSAARGAGNRYTPAALAGLSGDLGFLPDTRGSAQFLEDCQARAAGRGGAAAPPPPTSEGGDQAPPAVPLSADEFVEYLAGAAVAAEVPDARIEDYVKVFVLLHVSGIREQAGVAPL